MGISEEKANLRTRYRRERSERYLEHSFEHLADSAEFAKAKSLRATSHMQMNPTQEP